MDAMILAGALVLVTAGAEALVRGATVVALRAGLSPLFVGLTIVGFGTSTPELGASLVATVEGSSGVAVGNVIGSNIFNIAAILGVTALITPIRVELRAVRRDLLVALAASTLPLASLALGGLLPSWFGYALIGCLLAYLAAAYRSGRRAKRREAALMGQEVTSTFGLDAGHVRMRDKLWFNVAFVVLGIVLLVLGSHWFVVAAIRLARDIGMSELAIGLTVVSVGTSIPELMTSVVAAKRRNPDLAIGNVLGSNLFNLLGILGASASVAPQAVSRQAVFIDVPVMLVATVALLPIMKSDGMISRREGGVLVAGYVLYVVALVFRST